MDTNALAATAPVTETNGYFRADYAPHGAHGASASGYGASAAAARSHLADVLAFNVAHNGAAV